MKFLLPLVKMYKRPSPVTEATADLYDAEHSLLEAHKDLEWAQARITAYTDRIARLKAYIQGETK